MKQSVANTTPENETQLYTEAKAKIVKSIEDTLAKRSELIKSNIRTNFEDLKNSWENEINSRLESGEIDRNQLSDSIFKKYENLVKLVNSEEYLDQKISLDNNETEISKWYSAMTESILFLEEIRDNDPYDYYLEKEREEEILTKLEEAEQLISQLNDDKYQDIKTRLEEKINLNKNRYQTSKQDYISSQNKEITQVNQLTTIYQTILSDLTRALDEANNEKNTVDNN